MCGIAGFVELSGESADLARVERMHATIVHRGPDADGAIVDGPVGFGHRRLSIIDISDAGKQPMWSPDGNVCIVYNGEVYNYNEIRTELPSDPPYVGGSDTEVIIRAYQTWGLDALKRFNGMFAFALYDKQKGEVYLVRDRPGIKPLYYALDNDRLYFGSELKTLLAGGYHAEVNHTAAFDWIVTGWTSDEHTFIKGVKRVPSASIVCLKLADGSITEDRFWTFEPDWDRGAAVGDSEAAWIDAIEEALHESVKHRLVADVPVGTFCSGGIDSSLITAIAAKHHPEIHAFNVSNPDVPGADEGPWAKMITDRLGIPLHTYSMSRDAFRQSLVDCVHVTEYPLSFVNTVALQLVSQLARDEGSKVLLSGEGADEQFGGYVQFFKPNAIERVFRARGLGSLYGPLTDFVQKLGSRLGATHPSFTGGAPPLHTLLSGGARQWMLRDAGGRYDAHWADPLDRQLANTLWEQLQTYLIPILHRTDRATMRASIEARVPFLDHNFIELTLAAPPKYKVQTRGFRPNGKALLKKVAERYLPHELIYRKKVGFGMPPSYFTGEWPESWLHEGFLSQSFSCTPEEIRAWNAAQPQQPACWLMTLEMWGQMFINGRSPQDVAEDYAKIA